MNIKQQLFSPDEAFVRLGQTRQNGCLVIVSLERSFHLFVENGNVVHASGGPALGQKALENALNQPNSFYTWIPDYTPPQKTMDVSISAFALKNAVAKDVHIAATGKTLVATTGKVHLDAATGTAVQVAKEKEKEKLQIMYLVPADRPSEKLFILNPTVIVGRDPACDIVVHDTQVSRRHCLFQMKPKGVFFRDLDSSNGVRLNGVPTKEGMLVHKDKLELGTYALNAFQEQKP